MSGCFHQNLKKNVWMFYTFDRQTPIAGRYFKHYIYSIKGWNDVRNRPSEWFQNWDIKKIILYLFAGFKTIILCSIHTIWFMKYVFCKNMVCENFSYNCKSWDIKWNHNFYYFQNCKMKSPRMSLASNYMGILFL